MLMASAPSYLGPGAAVEVRCRFDGAWIPGFVVDHLRPDDSGNLSVCVRRVAEGDVLPSLFSAEEVRAVVEPIGKQVCTHQ